MFIRLVSTGRKGTLTKYFSPLVFPHLCKERSMIFPVEIEVFFETFLEQDQGQRFYGSEKIPEHRNTKKLMSLSPY